jgi:hypothetical protein
MVTRTALELAEGAMDRRVSGVRAATTSTASLARSRALTAAT